jgi:tRNA isopentenyl-2-thiomethyl-A-37 hydroxylase MiaE
LRGSAGKLEGLHVQQAGLKVSGDPGGLVRCQYFACRLRWMLSSSALGWAGQQPADRSMGDLGRRQVEFLTCLMNPRDERFTYDLRILSQPDPDRYARGRITLAIIGRVEDEDRAVGRRHGEEVLRLLRAWFPEYEFELVAEHDVGKLLAPFRIEHLVAITRRCARPALDTLRGGRTRARRIGFATEESGAATVEHGNSVLHIFPYVPPAGRFNALFKLLLLEPRPVAISCRLRPSALLPEEEAFLEAQIATCERYAQSTLRATPDDLSSLQPTLQEQARYYQRYLSRMLYGLKDNAAVMTVEIASSGPISNAVADAVGALLTVPAGGTDGELDVNLTRYLAGGYEVVPLQVGQAEVGAFERLSFALPPNPALPDAVSRLLYLFDSVEASAAFRLPWPSLDPLPGIEVRGWRSHPAPPNLPEGGLLVGRTVEYGGTREVRIGRRDRLQHVYVVGQTGTGKTTVLKTMLLDDIRRGEGVCLIDPHGDLYREILCKIPEARVEDVALLDPTDAEYPVGLNLLEHEEASQRHFLVQELVGIVTRIIEDEYGPGAVGQLAGPVFFQHMRMNLLLAMSKPDDPGTLLEFYNIYLEENYWRRWLPLGITDPLLERWVKHVLPRLRYTAPGHDQFSMGGYVGSKFEGFVFDPMLRLVFGQKRSTLNLRRIMDEGKVLLVNLAKGELTEPNARFLGMVLLAKLMAAAMGRVRVPERERRDFHVYVDEFQSLATQSFVTLLSEARKFGVSLVLANQFVSQIRDPRIMQAIFGNVGTLICFRLGQADAEVLEQELQPVFMRGDLVNLPNWQAYVATLVNGQTVRPFNMETILDETPRNEALAARIRQRSREKHGRPRQLVEQEIAASMSWQDATSEGDGNSG